MSAIVAENVTKTFHEGKEVVPVLKGVSLSVEPGQVVALEGPSGSGKTTFLSILGCILTPSSGRVVIDGQEMDPRRPGQLPAVRKRSIGFVFQQFNLFPALSALENVEYALNLKGYGGKAATAEASRLLELVGLGDRQRFCRATCPAGRSSASQWLARSPANQPCCSPTSPRPTSTPRSPSKCSICSASSPATRAARC